jgi:hypothetical protein
LETAEQKVADEVRDRERNQQQLQAAEVAMQQALAEHNEQAFAEAQRSMEEARKEREAIAEQEARLQAARDEKHNYKRSQKVQREGDIADGLQQLGGPSMQGAPPPTEAGRERLRATLEQAMKDFDANFNTMPDAMSCLGPGILEKVESLLKMTTADTDAVTAMLVRGRDLSAEESAELETEVTARDTERTTLIYSLMDELRRAQAICTSLMQAARLYLEAERARVAGERLAALEAIQHEQEMLMDATSKKRGAGDSPRKEGDDQAMVFRPKQGGAGGPDQPPPEPGSIEELNAMVVPKDELQQQKKEAQEEVDAAAQAVEDAAEALSKARKDADCAFALPIHPRTCTHTAASIPLARAPAKIDCAAGRTDWLRVATTLVQLRRGSSRPLRSLRPSSSSPRRKSSAKRRRRPARRPARSTPR